MIFAGQVNVKGDLIVGNLRAAAEEALGLHGRCKLVTLLHDTPMVLNDDSVGLCSGGSGSLRLIAGDTVQVEPSDAPTTGGLESSMVVRLWEVRVHFLRELWKCVRLDNYDNSLLCEKELLPRQA